MNVTYIHHSCFLVETDSCYYLFDYEKGTLPELSVTKPIFVLSSHSHPDHYNPEIFSMLDHCGMEKVYAVLSDDIEDSFDAEVPEMLKVFKVSAGREYELCSGQKLTTFESTDMGVAFLIEDENELIYHAGDLNDWVWDEDSESERQQMTAAYRGQIDLLEEKLAGRSLDAAFVVLDPRQEQDYDRGMCYFLDHISAKKVYPMHYWEQPEIIETFLREHPEHREIVHYTETTNKEDLRNGKTDR